MRERNDDPGQKRRQPWGELVAGGFASYVRTFPISPIWRFVHM
jgi:hypothetical protein